MPDSTNPTVPRVAGNRVDRTVGELSPSKNKLHSIDPAVHRASGPRVDRTGHRLTKVICFAAAKAKLCAVFGFNGVKPCFFANALLGHGFNPAVPRVAGPRVDRTVGELSPSQNMPDSIKPNVPLVAGPRVDRAVGELSPSQNMHNSTYLTVPGVDGPRFDRTVCDLLPPRNILRPINPAVPRDSGPLVDREVQRLADVICFSADKFAYLPGFCFKGVKVGFS